MPDETVESVDGAGGILGRRRPAADAPPRATAARKQASGAAKRRAARERADRERAESAAPSLKDQLTVSYMMVATLWEIRDPFCGAAAKQAIPGIVESWDAWAQESPSVHRYLSMLLAASGPMGVLTAHLPLVLAIVAHHGPAARAGQAQQAAAAQPTGPAGYVDGNGYDADGVYWGTPAGPDGPPLVDDAEHVNPYADVIDTTATEVPA